MCVFCNGRGYFEHVSGTKRCYCTSESEAKASFILDTAAKECKRTLPFEPTDRDMIHEEDCYGNDCRGGQCE